MSDEELPSSLYVNGTSWFGSMATTEVTAIDPSLVAMTPDGEVMIGGELLNLVFDLSIILPDFESAPPPPDPHPYSRIIKIEHIACFILTLSSILIYH